MESDVLHKDDTTGHKALLQVNLAHQTTCRTRLSPHLSICLSPQYSVYIWLIEPYVTQHPSVLCRQLKTNTVQIKLLHATSDWHTEHIDLYEMAQYGCFVGAVKNQSRLD